MPMVVRGILAIGGWLTASLCAAATQYEFTTFDVPGASRTSLIAVNNLGHILGEFTNGAGRHFFRFDGSAIVAFDFPQSDSSFLGGFNDRGEIVGLELIESVDPPGIINKCAAPRWTAQPTARSSIPAQCRQAPRGSTIGDKSWERMERTASAGKWLRFRRGVV